MFKFNRLRRSRDLIQNNLICQNALIDLVEYFKLVVKTLCSVRFLMRSIKTEIVQNDQYNNIACSRTRD